jgi:uncharacterized protein YbjT (DUF2867 family)
MIVAVAGGTGLVGTKVLQELRSRGVVSRCISRTSGVDLQSGTGLASALSDVAIVIDVANIETNSGRKACAFFRAEAENLQRESAAAGVHRVITLSIVGVDRVPLGYYQGKLLQERASRQGPVPSTIVRSTQFHEFAHQTLRRFRYGPLAVVPRMRLQPCAAGEVASLLVDTALDEASAGTHLLEFAGPKPENLIDMTRRYAEARPGTPRMIDMRLPGAGGTAIATGALLPTGGVRLGRQSFDEWLAAP